MDLTSFSDVDVTDKVQMLQFFDLNYLAHEQIAQSIQTQSGITINHFPLFTAVPPNKDWLLTHDQEHQEISARLNLGTPPTLDSCDFENQQITDDWLNDHYLLHQQIAQVLGI